MANQTDANLEQWKRDVISQPQSDPSLDAQTNAWNNLGAAQSNLQSVQSKPGASSYYGGYTAGPDTSSVEGAQYRVAQAKQGLEGLGGPRPWEQAAVDAQKQAASLGAAEASRVSSEQDANAVSSGASPDVVDAINQLHYEAQQARERGLSYVGEDIARVRQEAESILAQRYLLDDLNQRGIESARQTASGLQRAFDQAALDLDSVRIDPQRWEKSTPALAQVFMALASSAFAFFSGGRGVNPVVALIDRAIDRDVKAQMANADIKLKKSNMGVQGAILRQRLESTIQTAMYERAAQGLRTMMENSRDETSRAMATAAYQEEVAKLKDVSAERLEKAYIQAQPAAAATNKLPPDYIKKTVADIGPMMEGAHLVRGLATMIQQDRGLTPVTRNQLYVQAGALLGLDPSAGNIDAQIESFATRLARATGADVGNFAQEESRRFISAVRGKEWDAARTALKNIARRVVQLHLQKRMEIEALDRAGYPGTQAFRPFMDASQALSEDVLKNVK